jgi:hypothetical protein
VLYGQLTKLPEPDPDPDPLNEFCAKSWNKDDDIDDPPDEAL